MKFSPTIIISALAALSITANVAFAVPTQTDCDCSIPIVVTTPDDKCNYESDAGVAISGADCANVVDQEPPIFSELCDSTTMECEGFRSLSAPPGTEGPSISNGCNSATTPTDECSCPAPLRMVCYKCGQELDCLVDDVVVDVSNVPISPKESKISAELRQRIVDELTPQLSLPIADQDPTQARTSGFCNDNDKTMAEQPTCSNALIGFTSTAGCCIEGTGPNRSPDSCPVFGFNPFNGNTDEGKSLSNVATYLISFCEASPTHPPTAPPTAPPAHVDGDPHFTTWSGEHFDFQGECDLLLVDNPTFKGGVGMHIHGRTKLHGMWSAFSSVAIKMGDDVLEVHGSDAPLINGVQIPIAKLEYGAEFLFPLTLAGFSVTVQNTGPTSRRHIVHMGNGERIFINNFKEFVDLEVESPRQIDFLGAAGLMGNFKAGTNLARDGKAVIEDPDVFGQEWQVNDSDPQLFTVVEEPQYPAKCNMPPTLTAEQRQLRAMNKQVSEDDAKKACANAKASRMENCIADVFGSDNLEMAGIYETHSF